MNTIPQPNEAPALDQAFKALAGDMRAHAGALVREWAISALFQALILLTLARILDTLEAMVRDWKEGRLPALPPTPARRAPARRPRARTRTSGARTSRARTSGTRPASARPTHARPPAATRPAPARVRPSLPLARPRHAPACRAHASPTPAGLQKPAWRVAPPRALFVT
jgi:hypothetical protein